MLRRLPLLAALVLTAWVHRRSLFAFFSSPDDLRHLQQALGLRPTQVTPFRVLSQVLYFRAMVRVVGLDPLPYHLVTCGCHLLNVALAYRVFRSWQVPRPVAAVVVTLFGAMPLSQTLLSSAVGMNDELSLCLALIALLLWNRPSWSARVAAPIAQALALLCKELVLFLPAVLLIARPDGVTVRAQARRLLPFAALAAVAAIGFFLLRAHGLATDREEYAMAFGPNLFHNLMTFTAWATDLGHPMPDLISTYDVHAWRWALAVYAFLAFAAWQVPAQRRTIAIGLLWWLLALIPVLPLVTHTYRHYFYAALPGLALAVTAAAAGLIARFVTERAAAPAVPDARPAAVTVAVLATLAVAYAVRADHQIERRAEARIAGVDLALDPVLRRQQVAGRALSAIARSLDAGSRRLAILSPQASARVFSVRSGSEHASTSGAREPYDLLAESIDRTGGVRLFFPQIDSVAFLTRWTADYRDFDLFVPYQDGRLAGFGRGPGAHAMAAAWMMQQHWPEPARDHLSAALQVYPEDRPLRFAYARTLAACGDSVAAAGELRRVIAANPSDTLAVVARGLLEPPLRRP